MAKQLRDSLTQGLHEYMMQSYPNASELKHLRAQVKAVIRQEKLAVEESENAVQSIQKLLTAYDELIPQDIEQLIQALSRLQIDRESKQHLSNYIEDLRHHGIWNHHGANDAKGAIRSA